MIRKLIIIACCLLIPASASAVDFAAGLLIETPQLTTAGPFLEVDCRGYGWFISYTGGTEYSEGFGNEAYTNDVFSLGIVKSFKHVVFEIHPGFQRTLWQELRVRGVYIGKRGIGAADDPGEDDDGEIYGNDYEYHQRYDMIAGFGVMVKTGDKHGLCLFGKVNYNFYTETTFIGIGLGFQVRTVKK